MDKTGTLYKLTFPNGKSYIGITKHSLEHRIKIHIRASRSGRKLAIYNAIRKYGTFGDGGYNLIDGGEGTLGRSFTVSEETKAKISASLTGMKLTEEQRCNLN